MYAHGLPVAKIVDVFQAKRATVFRHLQVQCEKYPELRAERERHLPLRRPELGNSAWNRHIDELAVFLRTEDSWPNTNSPTPAERTLALWLVRQRTRNRREQLPKEQRDRLDSLGDWMRPLRDVENERRWHRRLGEFHEFVGVAGRMPRYRRFESEEEHVLGVWLHVQHQKRGNGTLPAEKLKMMAAAVPGWASRE